MGAYFHTFTSLRLQWPDKILHFSLFWANFFYLELPNIFCFQFSSSFVSCCPSHGYKPLRFFSFLKIKYFRQLLSYFFATLLFHDVSHFSKTNVKMKRLFSNEKEFSISSEKGMKEKSTVRNQNNLLTCVAM